MGAVAAAAALTLAACGSDSGTEETSTPSAGASGPATGSVNIYGAQPQNPLVPVLTNETAGGNVIDNIFTRLVSYNAETADSTRWVSSSRIGQPATVR